MIVDFGISTIGKSHVKMGRECQDSHYIKKLENGWYIAAVADGVGSAKNSKIGAQIAAKTAVEFCDACMPYDYSLISIKSMLRTALNYTFKQILKESEKSGEPIKSYDTTLSLVIYDGQRVVYAHSGDGGIFGLTIYGDYVEITKPQKGPDGIAVIPLRSGYTTWDIDSYEEDLAAVFLMTDGVRGTLCPYLLRDHENKKSVAYVPLASFFADPYGFEDAEDARKQLTDFVTADEGYDAERFYQRLLKIYKKHLPEKAETIVEDVKKQNFPVILMRDEQDDKTLVSLVNTELPFDTKEEAHFADADWVKLQNAWNRRAYPSLYQTQEEETAAAASDTANSTKEESAPAVLQSAAENEPTPAPEPMSAAPAAPTAPSPAPTAKAVDQAADDMDAMVRIVERKNAAQQTSAPLTGTQADAKSDRVKHDKPKKKGLLGKLDDFFG